MAKISANKLGEYLVATPTRRKTIIRDQKHPPTDIVARYRHAVEPAEDFFLSGGRNTEALEAATHRLKSDLSGKAWAMDDRKATAEALELLLAMKDRLFPEGLTYRRPPHRPAKLTIAEVEISVLPNILVFDEKRQKAGAVKLHYIKSDELALTEKGAEYVTTLLHQWVSRFAAGDGFVASPQLCLSVDVFRKNIVKGPTSQTRRMADIQSACEEIAARWPLL